MHKSPRCSADVTASGALAVRFAWPDAHDTDFVTSEHLEKVDMSDMMEPNKESQVYSYLCLGLKAISLSN